MAEMEKIVEKKIYEEGCHKKNWATKGEALGVGIPALVLGGLSFANQMFGGRGIGLFGGNGGSPENVNTINVGGGSGNGAPSAFMAWAKGCDEALALTNEIWGSKLSTMQAMAKSREVDVNEKFGLYKATRDLYDVQTDKLNQMGFGLYKGQRDLYDVLNERFGQKVCDLEKKVAVMEATRPYQDKLIQCEIDRAFGAAVGYTDKRTCKMVSGTVMLPLSPTVTGVTSYNACVPATTENGA